MIVDRPSCPLGYTRDDLDNILGEDQGKFWSWMRGQTMTICDGTQYDSESKSYRYTSCANIPHGTVVYPSDVRQFISGGQPLD